MDMGTAYKARIYKYGVEIDLVMDIVEYLNCGFVTGIGVILDCLKWVSL